ncbi:hypothetical protein CFP65_4560 [Kitasatospora sp. MMS16-BH015]|uniref:DUF5709 domain-containing protein n=1 Tax=Kitasatospora sp. MMS16-BH015 TaxID=2018025 RepID=UPI000CA2286D|nr:DUF5709 domain-containing protein [Kitasatospora sp. MMS16-BH015]AUG79302.1 hypothetical protein CFP65_4560 [Kitasatospora sp. MMS16-BH015]
MYGIDAGAAGAEEAAVHLVDPDLDVDAEFDDPSDTEPLEDAIRYTELDQERDAAVSDDSGYG